MMTLAARHTIPVMYRPRAFAIAGGLVSHGTSITWMYHQAGNCCGRILKGARAGDLPILQPSKFEMFINLRSAKALGLAIPQATLLRTDEAIR